MRVARPPANRPAPDRLPLLQRRLSPAGYRRVTLLAVWALGFIIVTGGAVRLSGSGLGCPDWPTCSSHSVVAPWQYHAVVEFGNRVVTGIVCVGVVFAVLGSRIRSPRRRDLSALSWGLVVGVLGQIVLGGEAVKHQLAPQFVMGHFLLSILLLGDAVVLYHRAGQPDGPPDAEDRARITGPAVPLVAREQVLMSRLMLAAAALVIFLGTVVTSSGPHGGDPKAKRLDYPLHAVARLHGSAVMLFLAISVVTLWRMARARAPLTVIKRGETVLVLLVAQGALGYLQYFTGVPAALVAIHIGLAAAVWAVTIRFHLGLFTWSGESVGLPAAVDRGARDTAMVAG
jgi:cytochrome c oxidase assembly protein subunit 15